MSSLSRIKDNGECVSCKKSVGSVYVVCFFCKETFHAVNCSAPTSICNTSFHQLYKPLTEKTGVNASRPGNFLFACDNCMTSYEIRQVQKDTDKIESLQNQVNDLAKGMNDIKQLLLNKASEPVISNVVPKLPSGNMITTSAWASSNDKASIMPIEIDNGVVMGNEDSQNVQSTSVLVIDKFSDCNDEKESIDKIEKVIDNENIDIQNSYRNKLGKTVIVCKSNKQRDSLKSKISSAIPTLPSIKSVDTMKKTIVVTGFNKNYTEDNIIDAIVRHNDFISDFLLLKSNGDNRLKDESNISLVVVKPLKNNAALSQVVLRVSSDIRRLLSRNGDKLRVGMIRCPVYDRFFVKRCYGCQHYGHFHAQCPTKNVFACGKCAGDHETKNCEASEHELKCVNCIRAGRNERCNHAVTSLKCPVYENELNKIKNASKN